MRYWVFILACWWGSLSVAIGQNAGKDTLTSSQRIANKRAVPLDTSVVPSVIKDSLGKPLKNTKIETIPTPKLNPRKSAYYSLALPGLGQIYNKQYWKVPLVYLGIGAPIYFAHNFNVRYIDFLVGYRAFYTNPTTGEEVRTPVKTETDVFVRDSNSLLGSALLTQKGTTRSLTLDQVTKGKDTYRRYRDLNIFLVLGIWALNAVEANVSAHLKTFDMSDDISFRFKPDSYATPYTGQVMGVKVVLGWK